jgi:FkbM family methyltransferase
MSWRTSLPAVILRDMGRSIGLNRYLALALHGRGYEIVYDSIFQENLREGDCVWDVGANVGYYTDAFSRKVGSSGRVYAIEPSPFNLPKLKAACKFLNNVQILPFGLGEVEEELSFAQGTDDLGATSRFVDLALDGSIKVQVYTGDSLIARGEAEIPNMVKIDVEGFELEVLKGLTNTLSDIHLRAIGMEVHFGILKTRGMRHVPKYIESILSEAGFSVAWPDNSHIFATRL